MVEGWQDALAQSAKEAAKWPYDGVKSADYSPKAERGAVAGQLVLNDGQERCPTCLLD